jgi:HPt (histidine-containing phosphotransfer) domain-containing protein
MCGTDTAKHDPVGSPSVGRIFVPAPLGTVRAQNVHMPDGRSDKYGAALLARVEGDRDVFVELCDIFLDDAPRRLAAIGSAVRAHDTARVKAAAHAFKGAAGVFDADAVVAVARRLEQMATNGSLDGGEALYAELEILGRELIDEVRALREGTSWKS